MVSTSEMSSNRQTDDDVALKAEGIGLPDFEIEDNTGGREMDAGESACKWYSVSCKMKEKAESTIENTFEGGKDIPAKKKGMSKGKQFAGVIKSPSTPLGLPIIELVDFDVKIGVKSAYRTHLSEQTKHEVSEQAVKTEFEFTYQTSSLPHRPGPASDAFLMPALTFDVIEVWVVQFFESKSECRIRGLADKSLEARDDLSGFYFITANDVETRTLPTLADVSAGVLQRLKCADGTVECCSENDKTMGCNERTLDGYCNWKHGDGTEGAARCSSITEDHWKTECRRAAALAQPDDRQWTPCGALENVRDPMGLVTFLEKSNRALLVKMKALLDKLPSGILPDGFDPEILLSGVPDPGALPADALDEIDTLIYWAKKVKLDTAALERVVTRGPQCPQGFQPVGNLYECETEDYTILEKPGGVDASVDDMNMGMTPLDVALNLKKVVQKMSSALPTFVKEAQTYQTQCIRIKPLNPRTIPKCSRLNVLASNLEDYCRKKFAPNVDEEKECNTFVESDAYTKAHDNWYNTLSRNYAKQEKAGGGADATVHYSKLDTLNSGPQPVRTAEVVTLNPMKGLAPTVLIDNAMNHDGEKQNPEKRESFKNYNTLSFEGGGSSVAYSWRASGSAMNGNNFGGYNEHERLTDTSTKEKQNQMDIDAEIEASFLNKAKVFEAAFELEYAKGSTQINVVTTLDAASDDSYAAFELTDPDAGDYFVITLWEDPEYPTPIFSLQGGASSCTWEPNTYHRAAPSMLVDYVGPESLPPFEAAVFKITLRNSAYYYEAGPSSRKERPGWASSDKGYDLPTLALVAVPQSVKNGLQVTVNGAAITNGRGIVFTSFGKGSQEVLVEVFAGPSSSTTKGASAGWLEYPAPLLSFSVECDSSYLHDGVDGESAVDAALGMAGEAGNRVVRFIRTCPKIEWSGPLLASSTFAVDASGDKAGVSLTVLNPNGESWASVPFLEGLDMQYRFLNEANHASPWVVADGVFQDRAPDAALASGLWTPSESVPDGTYEIRALVKCSAALLAQFRESTTPTVIRGIVDRKAPDMMYATSSSGTQSFANGDGIAVMFDEDVVCTTLTSTARFTVAIGKLDEKSIDAELTGEIVRFERDQLRFVCKDSEVKLSLSPSGAKAFNTAAASNANINAAAVEVRVYGIMDAAGNQREETAFVIRGGFTGDSGNSNGGGGNMPDPELANLNQAVLDAEDALAQAEAQNNNDSDLIAGLIADLQKAQAAAKEYVTVKPSTALNPADGDSSSSNNNDINSVASVSGDAHNRVASSAVVSSLTIIIIFVAALVYQHKRVMAKLDEINVGFSNGSREANPKRKNKKTTKAKETTDEVGGTSGIDSSTVAVAMNPAFTDETSFNNIDVVGGSVIVNPTYDDVLPSDESDGLPSDEESDDSQDVDLDV